MAGVTEFEILKQKMFAFRPAPASAPLGVTADGPASNQSFQAFEAQGAFSTRHASLLNGSCESNERLNRPTKGTPSPGARTETGITTSGSPRAVPFHILDKQFQY